MSDSLNLYDDIDYCLEVLYESIYNKDNDECYSFNAINKKDIIIDDLKKDSNFNYSNVLSGKFKFMGLYNHRVHYKRDGKYPCTIAIGFSNKKYNKNDIGRPELYNMAIMYMSSEMAFNEKIKNILLPIMCFDIDKSKITQIFPDIKKEFDKFYDEDNNNMYVIVTEHFFKMETLKEYLENNSDKLDVLQLKSIFFQIYYILLQLTKKYNKFRHNNLNLDSIRLYFKEKSDDVYKIDDITYILRDNTIEIKITDFDNSYFEGEYKKNNNPNILLNNLNTDNPYFDIHYITNLIYLFLKDSKSSNLYDILKYFNNFFNEIIPEKYRINNIKDFKGLDQEKYSKNQDELINSSSIIKKNIIFKEFIMNNIKEPIKTLTVRDSNINYIDSKKLLNKNKNKYSNQYYSMIKGSRKIALPGLTSEISEYSEVSSISMDGGAKKKGSKGASKKSNKARAETISATSFTITESSRNTQASATASATQASVSAKIVNPEITSVSSVSSVGGARRGSHKGKQSRHNDSSSTSHKGSSSSSTQHKGSSSSSSSASSSTTVTEKHQKRHHAKAHGYNNQLNPAVQSKLNKIPEGYFDLAPEHLVNGLQQGMEGAMSPGQQGMQGMPQEGMMGMPQQMGAMPSQMGPPPMPEYMKNMAMGGQQMNNMGPMNNQLGVPMDNQMASFMGMQGMAPQMGGGKKLQQFKLVTDNKFFF